MSNEQAGDKKIDIFEMMENVDKKNRNYYNELSDEQKKAFMPYLATQWISGCSASWQYQEYYLLATNEILNKNLWYNSKYPDLFWLLMTAVGCGSKVRHSWSPMQKRESQSNFDQLLEQRYPHLNKDELSIIKNQLDYDAIVLFCKDLGMNVTILTCNDIKSITRK
jgi:hypothetical protein